jgi:long-chain fatty acid transport protein
MRNPSKQALVAGLLVCVTAGISMAGAIDIPQQNARATGQADAFAAQADDASAVHYDPAGLTQLHGTSVTAGASLFLPSWEFHGAAGQEQGMHLLSLLPHAYVASDFGLDRFRFGLGVNNNSGLNESWGTSGPLQELIQRGHIYNIDIAPTVAFAINDHLSIGSAFNIYYGQLELYRSAVLGPAPTPLGNFHFRGQDWALGATPAIMWKIDDRNTIAAVYRSGYTMQYSGQARVGLDGRTVAGPSHGWGELAFPQTATLAYAFRPVDRLKVEADVTWTDWDVVRNITLSSQNPAFNQRIPSDWKSGFTYRLGTEYGFASHWTVRGGYAFGQNAVPSSTFSPLVPDSNYHLFAVGLGYGQDNWSIDAAYQFIYRETRHIGDSLYGPAVNGTWDNIFHVFTVSLTLKV